MTLYRPNGNFGPVCDPFDEVTDESLPIIFDASVLVNPNAVVVDLDGQNVANPVVSFPPDYRPRGTMGPVCDPPPTGDVDDDGNLPNGIGDTDPSVVNPFVPAGANDPSAPDGDSDGSGSAPGSGAGGTNPGGPASGGDPSYSGPTEPYRPDGNFGPVCDPFVPYNLNAEPIRDDDDDDDDGPEDRPDELDLVNPQPAPKPPKQVQIAPDYRPNGPFGPICDPFNEPPEEDDTDGIIGDDFDPDKVYPDIINFPNNIDYFPQPDTAPTIGLPTTDKFEDGIDIPSVAGVAFKYEPFWGTSDVNEIPASFVYNDPDPDKGDWDWSHYYYNGKFFEWDKTPVRDGKTGQEIYEGLIEVVDNDPDREGDAEFFQAETYCEEPWPDYVLDPYTDTNGNVVYRQVKSSPRTYQVQHETFCTEFAQKSAWLSQGVCSFEGNTRLAGNAANFTTRLTLTDTDTYTIRYKFVKRGELFLDYYDSPVSSGTPNTITLINAIEGSSTYEAPEGMLLDFDTRSSAYFHSGGTICPDGCGNINGSGTWDDGKIGYRIGGYEEDWDNNNGFTVEEALVYSSGSSGSKNGTGARARIRFSKHTVPGDSNVYTKINVKAILSGGQGYEVGESLTVPTWNNAFRTPGGGAVADRIIRVAAVAPAATGDPCAFGSKSMQIDAGDYFLTAFVENYSIGGYKPHWKDSPAACAIEIYQGDFTEQVGEIPCNVGIIESSSPGTATFASNGDLVVSGTCTIKFNFSYDDNPNTFGTALGTVAYNELGVSFTQSNTSSTGNGTKTVSVGPGTYNATFTSMNSAGFTRQDNNTKLCFRDSDANDCNAELRITVLESTPAGEGVTFTCGTEAEVKLKLRYDDDPTTQGLALSSATWTDSGVTLVRDTNKESGSRSKTADLLSGTYAFNVVDNAGGFNVQNPDTENAEIRLLDGGGSDTNATITLELKSSTGPNVGASFNASGDLVISGSRGYTNSYVQGLTNNSSVWSQNDVGTEYTFTATDPAKGMVCTIGIVPRNVYDGASYKIVTEWAVKSIQNYGSGYRVDDTFDVSYTHTSGGTVSAKVKIFSTRRGKFTTGDLIWSTQNNAVGYNESFTPFDD